MRRRMLKGVRRARVRTGRFASQDSDGYNGVFVLVTPEGVELNCIVSDGRGWEHVSVALSDLSRQRVPTWEEMHFVKQMFWGPDECVVQYHPRQSQYVNNHPFVLHLWRPQEQEIPEPPAWMVGVPAVKVRGAVSGDRGMYMVVEESR